MSEKYQKKQKVDEFFEYYKNEALRILGLEKFDLIKDHIPSSKKRNINIQKILVEYEIVYIDKDCFDHHWSGTGLTVDYDETPLQKKCSKMETEKLFDILNDLHSLNTIMYDIFKKQLTGNYSSEDEYWKDQKQWNNWIRRLIKDYLSPFGQPDPTSVKISINNEKLEILMTHQPHEITNFLREHFELLCKLTKLTDFVAYKERSPMNKIEMQLVISTMGFYDFQQLLNILHHIGLYKSFKKIITNCETIGDYNNFVNELVRILTNF
jgi:hypothetical protein